MLTHVVYLLNGVANLVGWLALAPIAWLPGWLSATLVAIVTGVLMLVAFKYTSRQESIRLVRNGIKANLLALSLFKDSISVSLRAQRRILVGGLRLFVLALVPMAVMLVPMTLLLGQLALWYQARPLRIGEATVVAVELASDASDELAGLELTTDAAFTVEAGPVRVPLDHAAYWNLVAQRAGIHELVFRLGDREFRKELAVGDSFLPTSIKRPGPTWTEQLLHPRERPFAASSLVQSIEVTYPERDSWTTGSGWWLIYWFAVSMVAAFAVKPLLGVNI